MATRVEREHGSSYEPLVWVTRTFAVNPATIIGVFHGIHGELEVYLPGHHRQFKEGDLTAEGRALLLPPRDL